MMKPKITTISTTAAIRIPVSFLLPPLKKKSGSFTCCFSAFFAAAFTFFTGIRSVGSVSTFSASSVLS